MKEPNNSYVLGIDPGKNGGFCVMWRGDPILVDRMPDTCQDVWSIIKAASLAANPERIVAYLEQVSSSPQMGVVSAFTFGNGFGHLEMALTAASIPFVRVRPQVWQKALGCLTKGDKNVSKARAQELYPNKKITHAIADAILIASYGVQQEKKNN